MTKYIPHVEAEALAVELLRSGKTKREAKAEVLSRYPTAHHWGEQIMTAAVAECIGDFELGVVEAYLDTASRDDRSLSAKEKAKREKKLAEAWGAYDQLTDPEATPKESILAAARLDKLLSLGWRQRLPADCW